MARSFEMRALAIWSVALGLAALLSGPFDAAIVRWADGISSPVHDRCLLVLDQHYPRGQMLAALLLGLVLLVRSGSGRREALVVAAAPFAADLVAKALKWLVGRPRPQMHIDGLRHLRTILDARSFPSGHVLASAAFWLALFFLLPRTRWRWAALLPIPLMMWDRVALGLHHPSDTLASVLLALWLVAILRWRADALIRSLRSLPKVVLGLFLLLFLSGFCADPLVGRDPATKEAATLGRTAQRPIRDFRLEPRWSRVLLEPLVGPALEVARWSDPRATAQAILPMGVAIAAAFVMFGGSRRVVPFSCRLALVLGYSAALAFALGSGLLPADRFVASEPGLFADFHRHGSDPVDARASAEASLARAIASGVGVVSLTNHDALPPLSTDVPGMEWSGRRHPSPPYWHLLVLGGRGAFDAALAESDPIVAVRAAKAHGACVIVAHHWTWGPGPGTSATAEELIAAGVDGFEIATRRPHRASDDGLVSSLDALCRANGLARIASSDDHGFVVGSPCVTFLPGLVTEPRHTLGERALAMLASGSSIPLVFAGETPEPQRGWTEAPLRVWAHVRGLETASRLSWCFYLALAAALTKAIDRRYGAARPSSRPRVAGRGLARQAGS